MAAVKAATFHHENVGSSNSLDFGTGYASTRSYDRTPKKLSLLTSSKSLGSASTRAGSLSASPRSYKQKGIGATGHHIDSTTSPASINPAAVASSKRSDSRLAKLHKRDSSGSSLSAATPYSITGEPFPDVSATPPSNSSTKLKPRLRKLSSAKDDSDQGRLDLSKSAAENEALPGLGIQDFGSRSASASEVNFSQATGRRTPHMRTTSVGSQISVGSASFKPTAPFVHPMRQTPNTPARQSLASSLNEDEARESVDIVTDDDVQLGQSFRNRSMSIPSTPQINPTPLSQSHTAEELGYVPKLTSRSQSNLSFHSMQSSKSKSRPRGNTDRSDYFYGSVPSPSSRRTSVDKAISMVQSSQRRSETDPQSRDERIRAARRKFDAKEAQKERKMEKEVMKKQERQRRKSEASVTSAPDRKMSSKTSRTLRKASKSEQRDVEKASEELIAARGASSLETARLTALPNREGTSRSDKKKSSSSGRSGWQRFLNAMGCGGSERRG